MNKIELAELLRDMADKLIEMENRDNKQTHEFMRAVTESFSSINKDKKDDKITEMNNKESSDIVKQASESSQSSKTRLYDFLQDNIANNNNLYIRIVKHYTCIKYYMTLRKASIDSSYIDGPLRFSISFKITSKELIDILGSDYDPENNTDITNDTHDGPFTLGRHYKRFRFAYHGYIDKYNILTQYIDYDSKNEVAILSFIEYKG